MKNFKIYKNANTDLQAVKVGFSWPAFFFFFWWMIFKKMWMLAALSMVLSVASDLSSRKLDHHLMAECIFQRQ